MSPKAGSNRILDVASQPFDPVEEMMLWAPGPPSVPPVIDFCERTDNAGLGRPPLFPRQKTILRLCFLETEHMTAYDVDTINEWATQFYSGPDRIGVPPDIWKRVEWLKERGYDHFREIIFVGGRRGGKGHIGAIIGARQIYRLLRMGSPQAYYGIDPNKDLMLFVAATNFQQARDNQFADLYGTCTNAPCFRDSISHARAHRMSFRTKADLTRIAQMAERGIEIERDLASVQATAISSNSKAGRGAASFMQMYDEMAHMLTGTAGPRTAEEVYQALTPALDQMGKDALIYIPTSPYTQVGQAYEIYEAALAADENGVPVNPDILVVQLPSWGPYEDWDDPEATGGWVFPSAPQTYDDVLVRIERRNPDKFKVERRAQWANVVDAYLPPEFVDKVFQPYDFGSGPRTLEPAQMGIVRWQYRGHADPSKSQHNFAVCVAHTEPVVGEDGNTWSHVVADLLHVWRPEDYDDHTIPYDQIEDELAQMILRFPTMEVFSYDQYGAFATVSRMKNRLRKAGSATRVREVTHTPTSRTKQWEVFKSALGMNWIHAYKDPYGPNGTSLLELELKFLQETNGRVRKQDIGPVTTDDLADAFSLVCSELLADQLDRLQRRENLGQARVFPGAQGGYHTNQPERDPKTARGRLESGRSGGSRSWAGQLRRP